MDSRLDGVLTGTTTLAPDGLSRAHFLRYKPADALCCPSGGTETMTYAISGLGGPAPVLVLAPPSLPHAGEGGGGSTSFPWPALIVVVLVAGIAYRLARRGGRHLP